MLSEIGLYPSQQNFVQYVARRDKKSVIGRIISRWQEKYRARTVIFCIIRFWG